MYVNVGAKTRDGQPYRTKRDLREALVDAPSEVLFYPTSLRGGPVNDICADSIPTGLRLAVVGPDPHQSRRWYATVHQHGGKPTIT